MSAHIELRAGSEIKEMDVWILRILNALEFSLQSREVPYFAVKLFQGNFGLRIIEALGRDDQPLDEIPGLGDLF